MLLYEHPLSSYAQKVKIALLEKGAQLCADYVVGEYRFERLSGSHWIVEEHPDTVSDLLLDWFGTHARI